MPKPKSGSFKLLITVVAVAIVAALAILWLKRKSPEASKEALLQRAEAFFKAGEIDKARTEYTNLLRADSQNTKALAQLGIIWFEQGAPLQALPLLLKAREKAEDNLQARLKLAYTLMSLGQVVEARKEAIKLAGHPPVADEALQILAESATTAEELTATEEQLAKVKEPERAQWHLAMATVVARRGQLDAAKTAVDRALALEPKSPSAHLALANFHRLKKEPAKAKEEFKAAAALAPLRSSVRMKYADFLIQSGAVEEAKTYLKEMTGQTPDYLPGWSLLAQTALAEKKYDDALALVENVFARDPVNYDARMLQAQVWLAKGEYKKAADGLEQLSKAYPNAPVLKYQLARAHLQSGNPAPAITILNQLVTTHPDYVEALLLHGAVKLRSGDPAAVIASMSELLKRRPGLAQAELLLAEAYRLSGRLDDAVALHRAQITANPKNSTPHFMLGMTLRQQSKNDEAQKAFETAAELSPENLLITFQLVELDLLKKDYAAAMQRVQKQQQRDPKSAGAQFLEGKILAAESKWDAAEAALFKALELDANLSSAYDLLIAIYITSDKLPKAVSQLEAILAKKPDNIRARMVLAMLFERVKDFPKSREAYEALLATSPDFVPALNNLAYLYSEQLNQLDKAADLARKAKALRPDDSSIADTLGWVLYRQADYQQALALIQEAANDPKLAPNPEVQFHLGMANYMMGQLEPARKALTLAANAKEEFPGKDEAKRRLALLGDNAATVSAAELEALVKQQPDDFIARLRLGEVYEKAGDSAKAAAAYEQVVKQNPKLLPPTLKLARLYAGPLQSPEKAAEFVKKAQTLAPGDAEVAGVAGAIAFQAGNFGQAYSLLDESARERASDPEVLRPLGWAAYSLGKVAEARKAMQQAQKAPDTESNNAAVKTFLALTSVGEKPEELAAVAPEVEKQLQADPKYVPALMLRAASQLQRGDGKAAADSYREVLQRFPDFAPAQIRLGALYVDDPANRDKANELATKARRALPDDPALLRLLGELSYHKKEYSSAVSLFQESATHQPLNAKSLFYLGMAQWQTKAKEESLDALQKAIAAGLPEPHLTEAKRILAESQKK